MYVDGYLYILIYAAYLPRHWSDDLIILNRASLARASTTSTSTSLDHLNDATTVLDREAKK